MGWVPRKLAGRGADSDLRAIIRQAGGRAGVRSVGRAVGRIVE